MSEENERLILENLKLVNFVLKKFNIPKGAEYEDYFQVGCVGLIKAVRNFKPDMGHAFSTYAVSYIKGELQKYKRGYGTHHYMFKIPRNLYDDLSKEFWDGDESENTDVKRNYNINLKSLEDCVGDLFAADFLEDVKARIEDNSNDAYDVVMKCVKKVVDRIRRSGTPKEKIEDRVSLFEEYIYSKIYGEEDLTQEYLAKKFEISRAYVCRVLSVYMRWLKEYYEVGIKD